MVLNKWKVAFFILVILLIAENILIILEWKAESKLIENETKCSNEICYPEASSFIFDYSTGLCTCFNSNKEIIKQTTIK